MPWGDNPNEVVHDDNNNEDDSNADKTVEHDGIGELLDDLYQDIWSNVRISTSASEDNFDHEHNIRLEGEGTFELFAKLVRDAR